MIIINDSRIAFDLFERRSLTYSDRPRMVFAGEMCGWEHALSSQMYSERFKAYRRNVHAILGTRAAVSKFNELQETEARRFALRVLNTPENLTHHIRTYATLNFLLIPLTNASVREAGAIILKITYGYTIEPHKPDPLVDLADKALAQFSAAASPGSWLVDIVPFRMLIISQFKES